MLRRAVYKYVLLIYFIHQMKILLGKLLLNTEGGFCNIQLTLLFPIFHYFYWMPALVIFFCWRCLWHEKKTIFSLIFYAFHQSSIYFLGFLFYFGKGDLERIFIVTLWILRISGIYFFIKKKAKQISSDS